jgi:hypothetical protein
MNRDWERLLAIAERMAQSSDRQLREDAAFVNNLARQMRDAYVRWLWGR